MYAAFWRVLPGPWWVKLPIVLLLIAAAVWALFTYVFPEIALILNPLENDVVIRDSTP